MPMTLVNPKMDMGRLLTVEPAQTSLIVPPTMLIDTDDAPPAKEPGDTHRCKVLRKRKAEDERDENYVRDEVPGHASRRLSQRDKEKRPYSGPPCSRTRCSRLGEGTGRFVRGRKLPFRHFRHHTTQRECPSGSNCVVN